MYCHRDDRRKTRADNFSEDDKNLLLSLIAEHVPTLEARKTDHRNNSAKYKAWAAISKSFHRRASHPRNFTQMKDLYRRLKLKAKKEVGLWLKLCTESETNVLPPGCEVTPPDDTSFLIYEMIKPYKGELCAADEEHDRLLAEEFKKRDLDRVFAMFSEKETRNGHEKVLHTQSEHDVTSNADPEANNEVIVKTEQDFEYVAPGTVDSVETVESIESIKVNEIEISGRRERASAIAAKRLLEEHRESPPLVGPFGYRRKNSNSWESNVKRRRTIPGARPKSRSLDDRAPPPRLSRFSNAFSNIQRSWGDDGLASPHQDEEPCPGEMSTFEEAMLQLAQAEHKAKMLVLQSQRRAESAKEEAYKMVLQNAQLQRDLLQMQYENVL